MVKRLSRAARGFFYVITQETSIRFMVIAGIIVLAISSWLKISRIEFAVILVIIFSILILEGLNTILERVIDLVEPRYKEAVGDIKDALAGLVLLASVGAVILGLIIYWPYIILRI
jgi:diacylglycerol kinase